eukprot:COSAG04_NODE_2568_length_3915_cov_5.126308_4_plen_204_part_00
MQQHGRPLLSRPAALSAAEVSSYRRDGYLLLDGGLAAEAAEQIIAACGRVQAIKNAAVAGGVDPHGRTQPGALAAEMDGYLEGLLGHPELQALVRCVLSPGRVAFDHAVLLNRGDREGSASLQSPSTTRRESGMWADLVLRWSVSVVDGLRWHTHEYADGRHVFADGSTTPDDPSLRYVRVFFYPTGFDERSGEPHRAFPTVD